MTARAHRVHTSDERPLDPAIIAAQDLRAIADLWPDLETALARQSTPGNGGRPTKGAEQPLVINAHVSDVMRELAEWVWFLARVLVDEADWTPPDNRTTGSMFLAVSYRVGHWTAHEDETVRATFPDDCRDNRRLAERTAHPSGARRVPVNVRCLDHDTNVFGQRVPCPGGYTVLVDPESNGLAPDMICNHDRTHRISPAEWQRLERKRPADPDAARRLLKAIKGEVA